MIEVHEAVVVQEVIVKAVKVDVVTVVIVRVVTDADRMVRTRTVPLQETLSLSSVVDLAVVEVLLLHLRYGL